MLESIMHLNSVVPKVIENRVEIDRDSGRSMFQLGTTIKLDFESGSKPNVNTKKRSSFLPLDFDDDGSTMLASPSRFKYISGSMQQGTLEEEAEVASKKVVLKRFITGSKYIGEFNQLGMTGKGIYKYPHGVIYDGHFNKKGEFHGTGSLVYPAGHRVEGIWKNGKLVSTGANFIAKDNSKYDSGYCKMPDRRFQIELEHEVQPAGQEFLTNALKPRQIPPGMYDTGYGFFDPKRKIVIDYLDPQKTTHLFEIMDHERQILQAIIEEETSSEDSFDGIKHDAENLVATVIAIPQEDKEKWVKNNCRKGWDEPVGFRPDLYEIWSAGHRREDFEVARVLSKLSHASKDEEIKRISQMDKKISAASARFYSFASAHIEAHRKLKISTVKDLTDYFIPLFLHKHQPIAKRKVHYKERKKHISSSGKRLGRKIDYPEDGSETPVSFDADIKSILYDNVKQQNAIKQLE